MQAFTRNHTDHSNGEGFQFEFFCDKCGSGYRSAFKPNKLGMAADVLGAASSLFGGFLGSAASASTRMKDMLRGPAWDSAFAEAIEEAKPHFHQCKRCGKWMCPEVCWNASKGLCLECAPDLAVEAASAQAQVAVGQIRTKAAAVDQTGGMDLSVQHSAVCPHCGKATTAGKFCSECGQSLAASGPCAKCGAQVTVGAKFCAECGAPRG